MSNGLCEAHALWTATAHDNGPSAELAADLYRSCAQQCADVHEKITRAPQVLVLV